MEKFDVLIVGAGLSGIGAACHLQKHCPGMSYVILEGREAMGGTWDLFRYPGIRSDSDMHTLGYNFKPWVAEKAIADGPSILDYIHETADEYQVNPHIRYGHQVRNLDWSSSDACWRATASRKGEAETVIEARFIMMCAGYYSYEQGYQPDFPGFETYQGTVVYPQFWPEDLDYSGKRVVVIGSGATAMTLVPAMAEDADHITMLQRSPTYVVSRPDRDWIANALRRIMPASWAYAITRWKNVTLQQWLYRRTRVAPQKVRDVLLGRVRDELGPDYDIETHFTPRYNPWDERLCLIPNSDLFKAIRCGKASVVTDTIETFTENGLKLSSGEILPADIVVSATGLQLNVMGDVSVSVDESPVDFADTVSYKGVMFSGVPNLISTFGYINASWTLRADLTSEFACRVLNSLEEHGADMVTPMLRPEDESMPRRQWIDDFSPGYMRRAMHLMPQQGDREPWINPQDYARDRKMFREGDLDDGVLVYRARGDAGKPETAEPMLKAAS